MEEGQRLRVFVDARWKGDIKALAAKAGVSRQTLYGWFRGAWRPEFDALRDLANALGVTRAEVVAAMDGDLPPQGLDVRARQAIREEVFAVLAEALAERAPRARRRAR